MKKFIPLLCVLSMALAEPPVGDSYATGHLTSDHEDSEFQRSLSQEYGPPTARSFGTSRNSISTEYGPPSARTAAPSLRSLSQNHGPPSSRTVSQDYPASRSSKPSSEYGVPSSRSLSTEYGVPSSRSLSTEYGVPSSRSLSTEYGVPDSRSISAEYGTPSARNSPSGTYGLPSRNAPSQEYGVPSNSDFSSRLSTQYGAPDFRSAPSEEYGVPSQRSSSRSPSQKYGSPTLRNTQGSNPLSQEYGVPSTRNTEQSYTAPKSHKSFSNSRSAKTKGQFSSRSLAAARNSESYSQDYKDVSQTYGVPSQRDLSDTYGVPAARNLAQEYGAPSTRTAEHKTTAIASSYAPSASSRSSQPSQTYGVPSDRDVMPSEEYGVPEQRDSLSNQGYSYSRDALNDLLNQEPANYDFSYKVEDFNSGSDFGHAESRQDNRAEGTYFVVLPDGTKQTVEYEADERGFKPRISVEPVDLGRSGGYDDNASDNARSIDGPY